MITTRMSLNRSLRILASAACLPLALAHCTGVTGGQPVDEVRGTVSSRTRQEVRLPATKMEQGDVDAHVADLVKRPLTAHSAAQVALLNNRRLRATLEELHLSQADLLEASLPANITLASSVRWPHQGGGRNVEMEIAGDVLNWLMLPLRRKMALREYEAAKRRVSHEVLSLAFEVKEAFYELQAQEQLLRRLEAAVEVNAISSDIARRLRDAGNIPEVELLQEQANVQSADLTVRRARGDVAAAREKVNRLLGLDSAAAARWRTAGGLPALPASEPTQARVEAIAVAQRQDLAAQAETLAALRQGYSLTRKIRYLPALNLGVSTEREVDGARVTGPTLDIEVPLFNRAQGRMLKATAQVNQAQATYEALEAEARSDVRMALARLKAARSAHAQAAGTLLPQRQRILRETLLQYNAMQISNMVLLRAKEDEIKAQREVIEAQRDYWVARAQLEMAAGGSLNPPSVSKAAATVHAH
jgi:cobalt-zinc-cadmium efflux system outer membrane protein